MTQHEAIPLKPIRTEEEHRSALAEIDRQFGAAPGSDEANRLEILCVLVADYERKMHSLPAPDPVEFLSLAMQMQGRSQADLAEVLGSRSRASEVLNRRRHLSADMIGKLANAWNLPREPLSAPYAVTGGMKRAAMRGAAVFGVASLLMAATVGGVFWTYGRNVPSTAAIAEYTPPDVKRHAEDGRLVEYRRFVPLASLPPHVVKAFVAAEDQDYFAHGGYSVPAILRAMVGNVMSSGKPAGASTITQQLAKNVLLAGQAPSISRKVKEIILARRIEAALDKGRILELYLNQIYFGGHAYGIAAAAEQYFGRSPTDLSVAEAAYLAALPKAPNHYRLDLPDNRERAKERRDWVLTRMADDGLITVSAAHYARSEPLIGN